MPSNPYLLLSFLPLALSFVISFLLAILSVMSLLTSLGDNFYWPFLLAIASVTSFLIGQLFSRFPLKISTSSSDVFHLNFFCQGHLPQNLILMVPTTSFLHSGQFTMAAEQTEQHAVNRSSSML